MTRFIRVEDIPRSLWKKEKSVLHLPPKLISTWENLLEKYNLKDCAMSPTPEGVIGGIGLKETNDFFAWRFPRSAAAVMMTMLDPQEELPDISNVFVEFFSGNKVFLADLPCGSGAASLSILSTIYELRKQKKIPRMPLHVTLLGGEISEYAQKYAKESLEAIKKELESQAITLEFKIKSWDACDKFSTTRLIKDLTIYSSDCSSRLLFLVNFSGFLERDKKWNEANPQFDELFRYSESDNGIKSSAIWIEPQNNNVMNKGGFFHRLIQWVIKNLRDNFYEASLDDDFPRSNAKVKHPLKEHSFKVNLAVIKFNLNSQNGEKYEA